MIRAFTRTWPLLVAAVGVAGLVFAAWRWSSRPPPAELGDPDAPVVAPSADEHFERVRIHLLDEFASFRGEVRAGGIVEVRAPPGMRVPVVKIHHEPGEFVRKGDPLVSFAEPQIHKAIEEARARGDGASEQRFRSYLEHTTLRAPCDAQVHEIHRSLGEVPLDEGIPVLTLADRSAYRFVVRVPAAVRSASMPIGSKFDVELEGEMGVARGTVVEFEAAAGDDVGVVLGLDQREGLEERLVGTVRVVGGKRETALVPRSAVTALGETEWVRAWDPDAGAITKRSVKTAGDLGEDRIVLYGIAPGEQVVVPGPPRAE